MPYYTIEQLESNDPSIERWRLIVYEDYYASHDNTVFVDVAEATQRGFLQDYVRDTHPEAKSFKTLSEERA